MLKSDLEYPKREMFDCTYCRSDMDHYFVEKETVLNVKGNRETIIIMKCRLCENRVRIPASLIEVGRLSQFVIER